MSAQTAIPETARIGLPPMHATATDAIDPSFALMAGRTTDMTGTQQHCLAVLAYADASELWRSCSWRPVDFSPDGSLVYAVATPGGQVDASRSAILDATTGRVLQEFSTKGTFGRASFDGTATVDIVLLEDGRSAIVRCDLTGSCNLATKPLADEDAGRTSLVSPYQLTANP